MMRFMYISTCHVYIGDVAAHDVARLLSLVFPLPGFAGQLVSRAIVGSLRSGPPPSE